MRKLLAPLMLSNITRENREEFLAQLQETKTDRVLIAVDRSYFFQEDPSSLTENLESHLRFLSPMDWKPVPGSRPSASEIP